MTYAREVTVIETDSQILELGFSASGHIDLIVHRANDSGSFNDMTARLSQEDAGRLVAALASTTPPAEAKTPDAGVGERCPNPDRYDRGECCGGHCPAPAGEDDTGVREAAFAAYQAWGKEIGRFEPFLAGYTAALTAQPLKADTPAGVGEPTGWPAGYQETFDAIGAAVTVHGDGMIGISVKAFYRALAYPDAALSTAPAARPGDEVERVRHVKHGTKYEVLGEAVGFQADEYGEEHPHSLIVYRRAGDRRLLWMLPSYFRDGRFVPAAAPEGTR